MKQNTLYSVHKDYLKTWIILSNVSTLLHLLKLVVLTIFGVALF